MAKKNLLDNTTVSTPTIAETVDFTDDSTGAEEWLWEFGDGSTSEEQNPSHTYTAVGEYIVTLTVSNQWGSNSITQNIEIIDSSEEVEDDYEEEEDIDEEKDEEDIDEEKDEEDIDEEKDKEDIDEEKKEVIVRKSTSGY